MKIAIQLRFEYEKEISLEDLCNDEPYIYKYSVAELKEMSKKLVEIVDDEYLSSEQRELCRKALSRVKDLLYINDKLPLYKVDMFYIKTLNNDELVNFRNIVIRVLNQHISLYQDSKMSLYSRMIDICAETLIMVKYELEDRNMNPNMTKADRKRVEESLARWTTVRPLIRFDDNKYYLKFPTSTIF